MQIGKNYRLSLPSLISFFVTKKVFVIITIIHVILFISFYFLQLSSDFDSLSSILGTFIRSLSIMLVLVVSIIILIIRNEMKDIPMYPEEIE